MRFLSVPFLLAILIVTVFADVAPYSNDVAYDKGIHGEYPVHSFMSSDLVSPRLNILQWDVQCNDGSYIMINPRGSGIASPGPMIIDTNGSLVWASDGYGQTYGLTVQKYKGEGYLTFWAGNDRLVGHGSGDYYMLDSSYDEVYRVSAAGGLDGDLHEFRITGNGTALITVFEIIVVDLSTFSGRTRGYIWDCLIQEVSIETNELLFQWRASDHYQINETYLDIESSGHHRTDPFDYFHINSVDKDSAGNYIISSRHMHTITCIDGSNGEILWILGGKRNTFRDLSGGNATNIAFQHHARWHEKTSSVTLFDNGADGKNEPNSLYTRGMSIALDIPNKTAELLHTYINPQRILSYSQGSLQVLDTGNVFMGYGINAAFTEYAPNGDVLCDAHFAPASTFNRNTVESYRAFKARWTGRPLTPPSIRVVGDVVYASWNGATEVKAWMVEGTEEAEADDGDFFFVTNVTKAGFETSAKVQSGRGFYVRVVAVDETGQPLGLSGMVEFQVRARNSWWVWKCRQISR